MNKYLSGFGKDPQNIVLFTSLEKVFFKLTSALYNFLEDQALSLGNMQHNSLFRLLFCPDLTIAMFSWQVFQPVPSKLYN